MALQACARARRQPRKWAFQDWKWVCLAGCSTAVPGSYGRVEETLWAGAECVPGWGVGMLGAASLAGTFRCGREDGRRWGRTREESVSRGQEVGVRICTFPWGAWAVGGF